jgi:hypothetical protein
MKSPAFSEKQLASIIEDSADAAKPAASLPSWDDVSHGMQTPLKHNEDGSIEADVPIDPTTAEGKRALGAYVELMLPFHRASAERASNVRGRTPQTVIRGPEGKPRRVTEQFAERAERKFHRARASIVVPEMPWKRKRRKGSA